MSTTDSGYSATDIITYIGVPLAVLGVLPILYNTVATLAALSKIKRMLRHSRLTALTRSDVVNRVIEVELPRYAVTPWDRFAQRAEYWQLSRQPSMIPGGSWTTFNWKTNTIGIKTQRIEYADQLRQPQVEVAFAELVAYLLDLGAVPDAHGWRLLRSTGLWTPMGCSLMKSPDGVHQALTIARLDDSDGHLSLKVSWSSEWTTRDVSSLPPYWIRLPAPPAEHARSSGSAAASTTHQTSEADDAEGGKEKSSLRKESLDSIQKQADHNATAAITCQITTSGLALAMPEEQHIFPPLSPSPSSPQSLYTAHLRIPHNNNNNNNQQQTGAGIWFASAATAYGTGAPTVLWNYAIPSPILRFAARDSVPCGVLVLFRIADEAETPDWATTIPGNDHDAAEAAELFHRRNAERHIVQQAEAQMPLPQRQIAAQARLQRESAQMMQDARDRLRKDKERREARTSAALQSPKWDTALVASHSLAWLQSRGLIPTSLSLRDAVGTLLHRMILDGQFASALSRMLDLWKAWAENGGMRRSDFDALKDGCEVFAQASLLVALIREETTGALEGALSLDLQECLRMWRVVRLG
ncbi:hypothetical protein F5B20DRAFT_149363 [Whalleya microplaca]|nr:hypothetical protein F5B20DRAFT_149363 [Whalleya microplaca]